MKSNNVTRLLDYRKIPYQVFDLPAEKLGALETAHLLQVPLNQVFKTIVLTRARGKPILAVIPGNREVDLKSTAIAAEEKKVYIPTQREAEILTGLKAGGISPLALISKGYQVLIDESAMQFTKIHISGGQLGLNLCLPVSALIELTHARLANISKATASAQE
ncbi:MAG: Cys-tRNA(Pro) deacylase [Anaerolineaceae bacterium]|nr:Cys-tRNA(Pro) deacylase [Anaerolineaceae bacterium]